MNDQTAQDPQGLGAAPAQPSSYVDEYVPPTATPNLVNSPLVDINTSQVDPIIIADDEPNDVTKSSDGSASSSSTDEDIDTQNIFMMLGVEEGDDDLKEKFLDQLQDVIWEDFLGNDLKLLLNEEEITKFKVYKDKVDSSKDDSQEKAKDEMVEFLEKIIPDLEDIMLEKALDLKADLFAERISGMKEYYAEKPDHLVEVNQAETLMFEDKWKSAAMTLNDIKK